MECPTMANEAQKHVTSGNLEAVQNEEIQRTGAQVEDRVVACLLKGDDDPSSMPLSTLVKWSTDVRSSSW